MTRKAWRQLAADVQTLAQCGRPSLALILLREQVECSVSAAWKAVQQLKALPEVKR